MNRAKIFIVFTFFLVFAVCVSAQDEKPKIGWKNLQQSYESFYDIKPTIINESDVAIYYDAYFSPFIDFERFDEKSGSWKVSRVWRCGTGYKPRIKKAKFTQQIPVYFGNDDWDEITIEDSIGEPKFKKFPEYNGTGKYRFKFRYGVKKSEADLLASYSPEFEVIEKDFKK